MEKLYKFGDEYLKYDDFIINVMDSLKRYNYADSLTISLAKKAIRKEVHEAMKDGVIKYIKENPEITINETCRNLKVNSLIIEELEKEGRIVVNKQDLDEITNELKEEEKLVEKKNKLLCFEEQAKKYMIKEETKNSKYNEAVFHTKPRRK